MAQIHAIAVFGMDEGTEQLVLFVSVVYGSGCGEEFPAGTCGV